MHNIDFLPRRIKEQRRKRRRRVRQGAIVCACVAVLVAIGFVRQESINQVHAEWQQLERQVRQVHSQLSLREELEKEWNQLVRKQQISEQFDTRLTARDVLAELGHRLPESMALTDLELEADSVLLDPSKPARVLNTSSGRPRTVAPPATRKQRITRIRLVITGLAPSDVDIANFVGQLASSPLFEDVNMGYTREIRFQGKTARQFKATCFTAR
jgi:Tfp pilus assembly protein PilN